MLKRFVPLRDVAGAFLRPAVLGSAAVAVLMIWAVFVAGYYLRNTQPEYTFRRATFELVTWGVLILLALVSGWIIPVAERPTLRQVSVILAAATALVLARLGMTHAAGDALGLRSSFLDKLVYSFPRYMLVVTSCVAGGAALQVIYAARGRAVELSRLEAVVNRTRLGALRNRVGPVSLLACLDAISDRIPASPRDADALLIKLSEMLRRRLHGVGSSELPLGEDLALVKLNVELVNAIIPDRVRLQVDVPTDLQQFAVPPFTLASLVDCCVAAAPGTWAPLRIWVRAWANPHQLVITVLDDGPARLDTRNNSGDWELIDSLRVVLSDRYDCDDLLRARDAPGGGAELTVTIPITARPVNNPAA